MILSVLMLYSVSVQAKAPENSIIKWNLDGSNQSLVVSTNSFGLSFKNQGRPENISDSSYFITGTAERDVGGVTAYGGYIGGSSVDIQTSADKVTVEFDFLVKNVGNGFAVRVRRYADKNCTQNGTAESKFIIVADGTDIIPNRWYKFSVEYESGSQIAISYLNGKKYEVIPDVAMGYGMQFLRIYPTCSDKTNFEGYIDNINLYSSNNGYEFDSNAEIVYTYGNVLLNKDSKSLVAQRGTTIENLTDNIKTSNGASIYVCAGDNYLPVVGRLDENCFVAVKSVDGVFAYYNLQIAEPGFDMIENVFLFEAFEAESLSDIKFKQVGSAENGASFSLVNGKIELSKTGEQSSAYIQSPALKLDKEVFISFRFSINDSEKCKFTVILRDDNDLPNGVFRFVTVDKGTITYMQESENSFFEPISEGYLNITAKINTETGRIIIYNNGIQKCNTNYTDIYNAFDMYNAALRFTLTSYSEESQTAKVDNVIVTETNILSDNLFAFSSLKQAGLDALEITDADTLDVYIYNNTDTEDINLYAATFSHNVLKNVVHKKAEDVKRGELIRFTSSVSISKDEELALFIWDSNLTPLSDRILFSDSSLDETLSSYKALFENQKENDSNRLRLCIEQDAFEDLKTSCLTDETLASWVNTLISSADRLLYTDFSNSSSPYFIGYSQKDASVNKVLSFIKKLAFAYQVKQDERYAQAVWRIIERVGAPHETDTITNDTFPDWKSNNFLSVASYSMAFAIAYDWCYDAFDDTQKAYIENSLLKYALIPAQTAYKLNAGSWIDDYNNRNIIGNSGIIMASLAIMDKYPSCYRLVAEAISNINLAISGFSPDGGWVEGIGYELYTLEYLVPCIQTLLNSFGDDFGLLEYEGLDQIPDFLIATTGPCGSNNFHDSSAPERSDIAYPIAWLGKYFNNIQALNARYNELIKRNITPDVFGVLWHDSNVTAETSLDLNSYFSGVEVVNLRSGWESDAAFLSFHGGLIEGSHTHVDGGSFVFDYNGERWACDLPNESYSMKGYASFTDTKNTYYRVRAEGHNTIVINPDVSAGQDLDSFMPVTDYNFNSVEPFAILDMSSGYKNNVGMLKRGYRLTDMGTAVLLRDEFTALEDNSSIYWFMHTEADVEVVDDKTVKLTSNNKEMILEFASNAESQILSIVNAEPLTTSPEPHAGTQADNSKYKKVQIKLTGGGNIDLTVKIRTASGLPLGDCEAIAQWN